MIHAVYSGSFDALDRQLQELVLQSERALNTAYAPYSNFEVGAALLMQDNTVVTGSNQENAAYPSGLCAERVALFSAASQSPDKIIIALAVVARPANGSTLIPVTPCGACRQVMLELEMRQQRPFQVIMQYKPDVWIVMPSAESLLPYCFTSANLK